MLNNKLLLNIFFLNILLFFNFTIRNDLLTNGFYRSLRKTNRRNLHRVTKSLFERKCTLHLTAGFTMITTIVLGGVSGTVHELEKKKKNSESRITEIKISFSQITKISRYCTLITRKSV